MNFRPSGTLKLLALVRQISVKSGVSTALYYKSIKLGTLILDIMGNIFKIRGNRVRVCVSQERVVKVVGGNYSKWPPTVILLWCVNIQHNCLKQSLIITIY